jgi:hypothetical protein
MKQCMYPSVIKHSQLDKRRPYTLLLGYVAVIFSGTRPKTPLLVFGEILNLRLETC